MGWRLQDARSGLNHDQIRIAVQPRRPRHVLRGRADGAYDAYLRVTGIDGLAEEFLLRGAEILDGPEDRIYGARELVIRDCNGLTMAFGEDAGHRATEQGLAAVL